MFQMNRVSRISVGALLFGAVLLPMAPAQAQTIAQPATGTLSATRSVANDGTGSSTQSLICTILRLVHMNQGPAQCQ
ncbi:hypothetical protein [Nocardia grenadensis]|uniref:hypothetical protein n=1 Tax=Nocardia grenadensis TaxID=931537 RepID=UPI0007A4B741|nr:hypothetical protein [Nocardia grenadensis]